jgi:hypothetical protein
MFVIDLIYMTFGVAFIAVAVFGHIPLGRVTYKPLRDDRAAGRSWIPETAPSGLVFAVGHDGCH